MKSTWHCHSQHTGWRYLHWWQGNGAGLPAGNRHKFWWGLWKSVINWRWTAVTDALNYCHYSTDFSRHVCIIQDHCISPPTAITYVQKFLLQLFKLVPETSIFYELYTWWMLLTYFIPLNLGLFFTNLIFSRNHFVLILVI